MSLATTIDGRVLTIKQGGITLAIEVDEFVSDLDSAACKVLADATLLDAHVLHGAIDRLAYTSESWSSDDNVTREEWLHRIGAVHAKDVQAAQEGRQKAWDEANATMERCRKVADEVYEHIRNTTVPACCRTAIAALRSEGYNNGPEPMPVPEHEGRDSAVRALADEARCAAALLAAQDPTGPKTALIASLRKAIVDVESAS